MYKNVNVQEFINTYPNSPIVDKLKQANKDGDRETFHLTLEALRRHIYAKNLIEDINSSGCDCIDCISEKEIAESKLMIGIEV